MKTLLETEQYDKELYFYSNNVRKAYYGTNVYIRGLIELSNYCKNNCY